MEMAMCVLVYNSCRQNQIALSCPRHGAMRPVSPEGKLALPALRGRHGKVAEPGHSKLEPRSFQSVEIAIAASAHHCTLSQGLRDRESERGREITDVTGAKLESEGARSQKKKLAAILLVWDRWQLGATSVAECKKESEVVLFCGIYSVKTHTSQNLWCCILWFSLFLEPRAHVEERLRKKACVASR